MSKPLKFLAVLAVLLSPVPVAVAQDSGYVPPPMFDDMATPMVRPQSDTGNLVEQKSSPNTVLPPEKPNTQQVIPPRISTPPDASSRAPSKPVSPAVKPPAPQKMQPIVEPRDAQKAPIRPAPKPSTAKPPVAPAPPATTKIEPVKRDPKQSVIQGPQTMPALPTEDVHVQETFLPDTQAEAEQTILERSQKAAVQEAKPQTAPPPQPQKPNVAPAAFDSGAQGVLKRTIPFEQGQVGLPTSEIDPLVAAVTQELDAKGKEDWRVQIKAYASAYGTGVSSDKRISLSRALSLRTALIAQGIPAARIDVLAEGAQSAGGGGADRIDLYLYGPAAE